MRRDEVETVAWGTPLGSVPPKFVDSPAARWPAIALWTPSYIAEKVPEFKRVTTVGSDGLWRPMKSSEFFARMNATIDYAHGWVGDFQALSDDAPTSWMMRSNRSRHQVWLGRAGTLAHYDHSKNLIAQIRGRKQFLLASPDNWDTFGDEPRLSPRVGFARRGRFESKIETVLGPGEVLYIPPFWWHQTRALGMSASLNVFTPSESGDFPRLLDVSLPAACHHGDIAATIRTLVETVVKDVPVEAFLRRLLRNRYDGGEYDCPPAPTTTTICAAARGGQVEDLHKVHRIADALLSWWGPKERDLVLADYVEELANYAAPRRACDLLRCLATNQS
ncbi:hypothetical protein CTAYLR_009339 [Chrysophaeum taylorii]|uniref:JmjC domain-containing protein n=1 Tax=Chrysophaeum taylorii TaxID=2483200 RepID=A0AAD7XJU9_9STRA|nr:hypothetical protein CTAYLR_009339 [Chrysophaeum taylorii]